MSILIFYIAQPQEDSDMQEDEDEENGQEQEKEKEKENDNSGCLLFHYLLNGCVDLLYSSATNADEHR